MLQVIEEVLQNTDYMLQNYGDEVLQAPDEVLQTTDDVIQNYGDEVLKAPDDVLQSDGVEVDDGPMDIRYVHHKSLLNNYSENAYSRTPLNELNISLIN